LELFTKFIHYVQSNQVVSTAQSVGTAGSTTASAVEVALAEAPPSGAAGSVTGLQASPLFNDFKKLYNEDLHEFYGNIHVSSSQNPFFTIGSFLQGFLVQVCHYTNF